MESAPGVVTFLFTDIEGSTRLWERAPGPMAKALARHDAITREAVAAHGGTLVKTTGDGAHAAFADPVDAIRAAVALQQALAGPETEAAVTLRVRCGLHAGVAQRREGDFYGTAVNRAARIAGAAHGGQVLVSQAVAELAAERLPEGVALREAGTVRLRDLANAERVFQVLHPGLARDFPPLAALAATPHNLPRELTSFVGRERDVDEVRRQVREGGLVCLTGAGGIGKTRLALQAAAGLLDAYPDGVWLVELAAIGDGALASGAVAKVLAVREEAGVPLVDSLAGYLRARRLLLVLDNCEHLVVECARLAGTLLAEAPGVAILATSREPLRIAGERIHPVAALGLPEESAAPSVADLARSEAVQLFAERVRQHDPGFALTAATAPVAVRICRRLDGIPLAIELAAARARSLALSDVEARLADRFALLTGGSRDGVARQQTLSALIAWSYDLLDAAERCLLGRLSVFAGGFELESAEEVCSAPPLARADVATLLASLVDKSLAIAEPAGDAMRYRQLETIAEFARSRHDARDAAQARARHAAWFLRLARAAHRELVGPGQAQWSARLEAEHANLAAALAWSVAEADDAETALRFSASLYRFWHLRGRLSEGRQHVRSALALAGAQRVGAAHADALYAGGVLAFYQSDLAEAKALLGASLAARREQGAPLEVAASLSSLANVLQAEDDTATARDYQEQALVLFREAGERTGEGICLVNLGSLCSRRGEYGDARAYLEQAIAVGRAGGHGALEGMGEANLGEVFVLQGDLAAAAPRLATALGIARRIGDRTLEATSIAALGDIAARRGDVAAACVLQRDGLALMRSLGVKEQLLAGLENAAQLLARCGRADAAVRLHAACVAAREALALPASPAEAARRDGDLAAARTTLGEGPFEAARDAGLRMPFDDAVEFGGAELSALGPPRPAATP